MSTVEALKSAEKFIGELPFSLQRDLELRRIHEALSEVENSEPKREWVSLSDEDVDSYILNKGHLDCVLDFSAEHDDVTELKTELRRLVKAIVDEMERINRE